MTRDIIAACVAIVLGFYPVAGQNRGKGNQLTQSEIRIEGTLQSQGGSITLTVDLEKLPDTQAFVATAKSRDDKGVFAIRWERADFTKNQITLPTVASTASIYYGPVALLNEPITSAAIRLNLPDRQVGGLITGTLEFRTVLGTTVEGEVTGTITAMQ